MPLPGQGKHQGLPSLQDHLHDLVLFLTFSSSIFQPKQKCLKKILYEQTYSRQDTKPPSSSCSLTGCAASDSPHRTSRHRPGPAPSPTPLFSPSPPPPITVPAPLKRKKLDSAAEQWGGEATAARRSAPGTRKNPGSAACRPLMEAAIRPALLPSPLTFVPAVQLLQLLLVHSVPHGLPVE